MIAFRHADPRFPFLCEDSSQPAARWNGPEEGPVQYLCDTPDGAWAEFLRHEEIHDREDLPTIRRALWAIEVPDTPAAAPELAMRTLVGGRRTYPACQAEARRLRGLGLTRLEVPSAALRPGGASGQRVDGGLRPGAPRHGKVIVLFSRRPDLVGWLAAAAGHPVPRLLPLIRHF